MTTIREASCVEDAMSVLPIRNAARMYMTRHREMITEDQQRQWFDRWVKSGEKTLYLVESAVDVGSPVTVGYGLIAWDPMSDYAALTAAMDPGFRGKGYGRLVFGFLVAESKIQGKIPWIEVLASNATARSLYHKLGFVETSRTSVGPERVDDRIVVDEVISMIHARSESR